MGDTLRAPNVRAAKTSSKMPQPADPALLHPPASSQPRKFDLLAESQPPPSTLTNARAPQGKKDNSMRLEVGNYMNSPPVGPQNHHSRQNLTLFMFNPGRQDLISQLLNTMPVASLQGPGANALSANQRNLTFPSYYMGNRDSVSASVPMDPPTRLRGDSIFLPPPVTSKYSEGDAIAQIASGPNTVPGSLRLNSIFSSLIQIPGSNGNSVSGQSSKDSGKPASESRNRRSIPSTHDYYQDDEPLNKDSLSNILGWNQDKLSLAGPGLLGGSNKRTPSKLFDNTNSFWESMNTELSGLIAGISNNDLNAFLANLQHQGSIDFSNMSNEQRRDSILKLINTQQGLRKSSSGTKLREDIFDKLRKSVAGSHSKEYKSNATEGDHFSPTSSLSLKSSHKFNDESHSPKTSPGRMHVQTIDPASAISLQQQQQHQQQFLPSSHPGLIQKPPPAFYQNMQVSQPDAYQYGYPEGMPSYQPQGQLKKADQYPNYGAPNMIPTPNSQGGGRQANMGYQMQLPPSYLPSNRQFVNANDKGNYSYQQAQPVNRQLGQPFEHVPEEKHLVPAQQYAQSEDGRPLLGATKVDQLMLVIQAREKGNTGAIKQAADGSILASPNSGTDKGGVLPLAVDLVGGIEKPTKEDEGEEEQGEKKKKRKGKTQQCPYCFKQFNQSTHLDVHVRSHIGYKPFQCTFCLKRFTQGGNLRTHMRLHTGEKPFTCNVCSRSFSRKGNLAAHMLTHNKEKPYECKLDGCDKSFTQLGNLKSHQNKFHLPTLNRLTQTLAELSGEELANLSDKQKELLDYFRTLYKNSNKGIRGRGKGKRVATVNDLGDAGVSAASSAQTSPQQDAMQMHRTMQQMPPQSPGQLLNANAGLVHGHDQVNYGPPDAANF